MCVAFCRWEKNLGLTRFCLYGDLLQVTEFQTGTGLPHVHAVAHRHLAENVSSQLNRLQMGDVTLKQGDVSDVLNLATGAVTASLSAVDLLLQFPGLGEPLAARASSLAKRFQDGHSCAGGCRADYAVQEGGDFTCRYFFPRLPALYHLVATVPEDINDGEFIRRQIFHEKIQRRLKRIR